MLSIFEDEWHKTGPISSNPEGTWRLSPLDVALRGLKGAVPTAPLKASQQQKVPRQHCNLSRGQVLTPWK